MTIKYRESYELSWTPIQNFTLNTFNQPDCSEIKVVEMNFTDFKVYQPLIPAVHDRL